MQRELSCCRIMFSVIMILLCTSLAQANPGEPPRVIEIKALAVMPFAGADNLFDKQKSIEESVDCKIFGLCSWQKEESGSDAITTYYQQQLRKKLGHKLLSPLQTEAVFAELPPLPEETLRNAATRFGRETMASHVLTGTVWRYRMRSGTPMVVEKSASVGFNVILVRTRDGAILWHQNFDKTQTSLSDNLLDAPMFVSKGMKWLTADELASFGVEKTLRVFPKVIESE